MKMIAVLSLWRGRTLEPQPVPVLSREPVLDAFLPMNELTEFGD